MMSKIQDYCIIQDESEADIIVINSCTVTNKADREVRSYARKYTNKGKKVIFTGCGVKHLGKDLFQKGLVHSVFAHSHKEDIKAILQIPQKVFLPREKTSKYVDSTIFPQIVGKVRAFIKIQEGCNFSCSYCIIPSVRGMARSFSEEHILTQIKILASKNVSEVILTGTNIGSYGIDTKTHIADLLQKIHDIHGISRIRLGSLEPSQIDEKFLQVLKLEKIERHLHIALQHTSPEMLKIMNRKNTFPSDLELFTRLANEGFSLGTDYIIGHYGESEEIFYEAFENLKRLPLTHIHPFIYSPRTGTASARNTQKLISIRGDIAKKRLKQIEFIVKEKNLQFRKQHSNIPLKVLIEGQKNLIDSQNNETKSYFVGLDQYFNKVFVPCKLVPLSLQDSANTESYSHKNFSHKNNFQGDKSLYQKDLSHINKNELRGKWVEVSNYTIETNNFAKDYKIL